jgi:hypothetical protein
MACLSVNLITMTITPSYFDWLPTTDVIHEWIMPMLDYESRIQFNQTLKPIERMSWRFPAEDILSHELTVMAGSVRQTVDRISNAAWYYLTPEKRRQKKSQMFVSLLNKFREGRRERILLLHVRKFHEVVIKKCYSILDEDSNVLEPSTPYFKKKIRGIAAEILPGLMEIQPSNSTKQHANLVMGCAVAAFR